MAELTCDHNWAQTSFIVGRYKCIRRWSTCRFQRVSAGIDNLFEKLFTWTGTTGEPKISVVSPTCIQKEVTQTLRWRRSHIHWVRIGGTHGSDDDGLGFRRTRRPSRDSFSRHGLVIFGWVTAFTRNWSRTVNNCTSWKRIEIYSIVDILGSVEARDKYTTTFSNTFARLRYGVHWKAVKGAQGVYVSCCRAKECKSRYASGRWASMLVTIGHRELLTMSRKYQWSWTREQLGLLHQAVGIRRNENLE